MRLMTVLGTRPEIIRLSRTIPKLDSICEHILVHTGQNEAPNLKDVFFEELDIRRPDAQLGVDVSSVGRQLGTLFERFDALLEKVRPDRILILGDTNSGLVSLLCRRRGLVVYHLEAGNRCYDDRVPEEVNRRVIDHCSDVLMPYTNRSAENLVREGIARHRIFVIGNPIFEVLAHYSEAIDRSSARAELGVESGKYLLATLHRAENVNDTVVFNGLCDALESVAELYQLPLILSVHPRIKRTLGDARFKGSRVKPIDAMPFFSFVNLEKTATLVLTDSGTVQEECAILKTPVVTIRDTTERPETIEAGSNLVSSTRTDDIVAAVRFLHDLPGRGNWDPPQEYLAPNVSDKIVRIILSNPEWASGRV